MMWLLTEVARLILRCIGLHFCYLHSAKSDKTGWKALYSADGWPQIQRHFEWEQMEYSSTDLNPIEHTFQLLKTKLAAEIHTNK